MFANKAYKFGRHDAQHYDTQNNSIQHNDCQHNNNGNVTLIKLTLSIMVEFRYA
jgi:hypothetical protein